MDLRSGITRSAQPRACYTASTFQSGQMGDIWLTCTWRRRTSPIRRGVPGGSFGEDENDDTTREGAAANPGYQSSRTR